MNMPQNDMTMIEKINLLDKIKVYPPNTSQRKLAGLIGDLTITISRVLLQEEK